MSTTALLRTTLRLQRHAFGRSNQVAAVVRSASSFSSLVDENDLLQFDTLAKLQINACEYFAENELFGTFNPTTGLYDWMKYKEFEEKVALTRGVLKDLDVKQYDKIGIISNNRWEWVAISAAAHSLNATLVPMYEAQLPKDWTYILNDSQCSALMCASQEIYEKVMSESIEDVPSLQKDSVLCFDASLAQEHAFATFLDRTEAIKSQSIMSQLPQPEDLANLVYTSGTTGVPKGVELTHNNIVSNVMGVRATVSNPHDFIRQTDRSLAFLPWAHSYGQTCELWCSMAHGGSMGICRGVPSILEDLQLVQPTVLFSVPTLYKKIYDGVNNLIASSNPIRRGLMNQAIDVGKANVKAKQNNASLSFIKQKQYDILDKIVLDKIRAKFGGRLRHAFVAGAACPREIIEFMDAINIAVYEGYGLTETSPIICINSPDKRKVGAVGYPIGGVTVCILGEHGNVLEFDEEGEICCYGPNVMKGYYNKPNETSEVISIAPDGHSRLFHSGDLGKMSEDGFIYVTGRIKEQYKLENGKYVCPTPVEEAIGMSRFIMQIVLVGANRPSNVALLVPDFCAIRSNLNVDDSVSEEDLVNDVRVKSLIDAEIELNCLHAKIKKFEIPTAWSIVAPFTVANNMLTPKMSIRRHMVVKSYQDVIAQMYGDSGDNKAEDSSVDTEIVA